jgi:DNA-binding MarR family transcriptional regulator
MKKISKIGSLVKRIYRNYSIICLTKLKKRGFTDLRPSFLEILIYICEVDGPTIKSIGENCGLKKQTMTSHLNELEKRGYIFRLANNLDKREQNIFLTEFGYKFKFSFYECIGELEGNLLEIIGELELGRVEHQLFNFHNNLEKECQKFPVSQII